MTPTTILQALQTELQEHHHTQLDPQQGNLPPELIITTPQGTYHITTKNGTLIIDPPATILELANPNLLQQITDTLK